MADEVVHLSWLGPAERNARRRIRRWVPQTKREWAEAQELGQRSWILLHILSPKGLDGRP